MLTLVIHSNSQVVTLEDSLESKGGYTRGAQPLINEYGPLHDKMSGMSTEGGQKIPQPISLRA